MEGLSLKERIEGLLLGTAAGDALGLPAEGIPPQRIQRLFKGPWRHRLFLGRGMISDDTEHTALVARSIIEHPDSSEEFMNSLSRSLKWWLLAIPAGVGFATLRAILRLLIGFSPERSGVHSAGNGPAMRSAIIGACFSDDPRMCNAYVSASTRITHTDPRALCGAVAVADIAAWCVRTKAEKRPAPDEFLELLHDSCRNIEQWDSLVEKIRSAIELNSPVDKFARTLGLQHGVSGYVFHTVPVALYAWYRHFGDFETTLTSVLNCGGDTDTAGAIAGALAGTVTGRRGIPEDWVTGICDWPIGVEHLTRLADSLEQRIRGGSFVPLPGIPFAGRVARNAVFLIIVLFHALRRLFPPYQLRQK